MALVVAVHGIGHQLSGPDQIVASWLPALCEGVGLAGAAPLTDNDVTCAFYGDLFRAQGKALGDPLYSAADVAVGFERDLLEGWWREAVRVDPGVPGPHDPTKLRTPLTVQAALNALSHSRFFAGLADRAMIGALKQMHRYFVEPTLRKDARARVAAQIGEETRVVVAHSLGTVVAYEALCAWRDSPVAVFVTLGSPLGIRNLIFERLDPRPQESRGRWPDLLRSWVNIADRGDIVALVKDLSPRFGPGVTDLRVHNGARAHDAGPYLSAKETGRAIAVGLRA